MEICVDKRSVLFYSLKLIKLKQVVELTLLYPLFASSSASQFLFILYTFYFTLYTKPTTSPAQTS